MRQPEYEHSYSRETLRKELIEKSYEEEKRKKAKKKNRNLKTVILVLFFFLLISIAILIFILIDKTKIGVKDGEVSIDETVTNEYGTIINKNTRKWKDTGNKLNKDIEFSQKTVYDMGEEKENDILVKIEVPTVDFYSSELNVTTEEAKTEKVTWVDYEKLTPETRVVSIDNDYFFDTFTKGARYTYLSFNASDSDIVAAKWIATADQDYDKRLPQGVKGLLSFAQTGVTALVRAMTITLNNPSKANGRGSYFADNIKDFLSSKDLTHISNEASFVNDCKGSTGTMMLCSDWRTLDSITAIGTDIVELTGNHNNNYGTEANIATINKYHELGIKTFGGGVNEEEAKKPLELNEKGIGITLLGYNKSSSTVGNGELSSGNTPGANGYDEATAKADIEAAKKRGDIVIVDLQFSECYAYPDGYTEMPECDAPINGQQGFFRQFIDWGADIVIGTQAHHPQTYEFYNGKPIYYGLGNFFFDQTYWPGTQRGYILTHYFDVNTKRYLNTRISPTWYDEKHQVYLTNEETSESFIARLMKESPKGK
ncbi:CapA family protein [Candidatus Saccharibacteria bacterium]|nr:CapA family protein [Candidatus Saccharibacteria bacterium]